MCRRLPSVAATLPLDVDDLLSDVGSEPYAGLMAGALRVT